MRLLHLAVTAALLLHLGAALLTDPNVILDSLEKQHYSTTVIAVIPASTIEQVSSSFSVTYGKIQVAEATARSAVMTTVTLYPGGKTVQDAGASSTSGNGAVPVATPI